MLRRMDKGTATIFLKFFKETDGNCGTETVPQNKSIAEKHKLHAGNIFQLADIFVVHYSRFLRCNIQVRTAENAH